MKEQVNCLVKSQAVIEKALLGDLTDAERRGLLEEHHEHHKTLFGDRKVENDRGLVGQVATIATTLQRGQWMAKGAQVAFGVVGAAAAFIGWKGIVLIVGLLAKLA